jgi:hypothetical protein
VNLYSLLVYIEHNGDESPKDHVTNLTAITNTIKKIVTFSHAKLFETPYIF